MGFSGLLENWPLCPNGCQPRGIDGAQLSPIIATAGLSKKEERGGVELSLQWGGEGSLLLAGVGKKWGQCLEMWRFILI